MKLYLLAALALLCLQLALATPTGETETEQNKTDTGMTKYQLNIIMIELFSLNNTISKAELGKWKAKLDVMEEMLDKKVIVNVDGEIDLEDVDDRIDLLIDTISDLCEINETISKEGLKKGSEKSKALLKKVDNITLDNNNDGRIIQEDFKNMNTEEYLILGAAISFCATDETNGNISISKEELKEGINKVADTLEKLEKDFVETDKNYDTRKVEIQEKMINMKVIVDTSLLKTLFRICDKDDDVLSIDKLKKGIKKFKDALDKADTKFKEADKTMSEAEFKDIFMKKEEKSVANE